MCKRFLMIVMATFLCSAIAHAESESPQSICMAEAKDAGIEDKDELQAFVAECVEQVSQEMEAERKSASDEDNSR